MANPRIFVSSTSFDLLTVRSDLEQFMKSLNFEPVLNEKGNIPYGSQEKLEEYCYKEIEMCDMLISIVGGRYGSKSSYDEYSISQNELKKALELGKQVYIFIDRKVKSEQKVYANNKHKAHIKDIKFETVDSIKIFDFIEEIESLPLNNAVHHFDTSSDIISFLREQWSGLFKALLQESSRKREYDKLSDLNETSQKLNSIVEKLTNIIEDRDSTENSLLLFNHPIFEYVQSLLSIPHRVYFINYREFSDLINLYGFIKKEDDRSDRSLSRKTTEMIWEKEGKDGEGYILLIVQEKVFSDNGKLNLFTKHDWQDNWISLLKSK